MDMKQPISSHNPSHNHRNLISLAFVLAMALSLGGKAWAQTDYSGTYYLRNMQATNAYWYLVPCMGSGCYYQDNEATPFITTYQTNQDMNSLWRFVKVTVNATDYYRIIHNATGLYVTFNEAVLDYSANVQLAPRLRLHLEAFNTPSDATLFFIKPHTSNGNIAIRPKDGYDDVNAYYWWDIGQSNYNNYWNNNWQGELGLWNTLNENQNTICRWQLISASVTCATPIISYNESDDEISISYPIAGDGSVTIHYTTDGSEPTTSSPPYSAPFSATDVKMVRAIAVKSGYDNSAEAVLYDPNQPYLFKTIDAANVSYYMIPPVDDDVATDLYVTTSNVPNPRMQWLLKPALLSAGVQYYYFVNAVTGKYTYCNANENAGSALLMKDLDEAGTEADRYMFRFIDYGTYLNIVPKKFARLIPSSGNKNCLRKQNATDHTNPIGLYGNDSDLARWTATALPADPKSLWPLPAELVSSTGNVKYLKLRNGPQSDGNDYFVYPPSANAYCTAAASGDHPEWYLWPAEDNDTWCIYYYIRNAYTGQYLYFEGVTYNNNDNKFFTNETAQGDKSKFLVLHTANTTHSGSYHIVPKPIRNNSLQNQIALNRNNTTLRTIQARNTNASCWFLDATTFTCDAPTFTYDEVQGVLSMVSPNNASIYYVGWNDGDSEPSLTTPAEGTLYTGPIDATFTHYKAIAARCTDGSDKSTAATYNLATPFRCATPVISFNSSTHTISISCATLSATIYYIVGNGDFSNTPPNYGGTIYTAPFTLSTSVVVKAIAIRDGNWSTASVVTEWDEMPHYIGRASDMTSMGFYYVANEGFVADATIGTSENPFTGTFDGGYVTFSLSQPLFDYVDGGTVKNVRVSTATVSGSGHKGALVNNVQGSTRGAARIYNCGLLAGSVTSSDAAAGGLVGHIASGSSVRVVNCYNFANVSGSTYAAGIVGWNEGTIDGTTTVNGTGVRITNCIMYGDITNGTVISPVYCGNHTDNQQKLTEYNFWRSKANLPYTVYNDQLAIGPDSNLDRFPFYRHILNTHREMAAYFLFADHTDAQVAEIGHWVLDTDIAPYPIVEPWETNTTKVLSMVPPTTSADYAGKKLTTMGSNGDLAVTVKIGSQTYSASLPITDMDTLNYDFTWGKVVLPFANEFSGWTRDYDYVCTGWKITSVTKNGSALTTFNIPSTEPYNFANRDNPQKDIYDATYNSYVFAQGGNYIVPYGVTAITIEAHFARAYYLSDPYSDVGYNSSYNSATNLGWAMPTTYHGKTVYTSLSTLVSNLSTASNPNDQAIVLVGNFHHRVTNGDNIYLNTAKAVTIMSVDEDNNQEPDYAWYMGNTHGRIDLPPIRFDVPNIEIGMAAHVKGSKGYPGSGIWHVHGWFELTENSLNNSSQFEINSSKCNVEDNGHGNNRWIANSGCFVQVVRCRASNCSKLSYIQIGGNAYIKELYPGSHTDNANTTTSVPIMVNGGQVDECYMTGYRAGATLIGDMIYFWSAGGLMKKWLGSYLENPSTAGVTAKIDHARIYRFFGGGTSPAARVKGDIDITINNSLVDFYCGGPEFGDMYDDKTLATHATGTTFGVYYGAGFGGTSITYNREAQHQNDAIPDVSKEYPLSFSNYYKRLVVNNNYGIGTCYKFEYIYNSNATTLVSRFYTGYAQFSLAETRNVTNVLENCTILNDFYGAGCQGKVNGTVTSTLTNCTVNGSAYGGGYKATSNEVSVYPATQPTYSVYTTETGLFSDFGTVAPETYTWIQGTAAGSNQTNQTLTTTTEMSTLGTVTGNISLTIENGTVGGNVFGGGNESPSNSNTSVFLRGNAQVTGNVYGGGNKAVVGGASSVTIQDEP